ncbi:hypothetical protein [Massilia sp. TN1-12]|uniref:hypothetical protein n=1 Tax=Massilia paldalensis TaxID=3377675 RepID=UPI00384B1027
MYSAFTHQRAETKAGRLAQAVRRAALACALVLVAVGAMAQQYGERRDDQVMQGHRAERFQLPPQDRDNRQADNRQAEFRAMEEQRRMQQDQQQSERRGGRMTQDERRDLRRQINEAGRDLYPRQR